jgi:hypothetical protein
LVIAEETARDLAVAEIEAVAAGAEREAVEREPRFEDSLR